MHVLTYRIPRFQTVMSNHPESMLVSPATAGNGLPWFDQFFGNCTALYGGTNGYAFPSRSMLA